VSDRLRQSHGHVCAYVTMDKQGTVLPPTSSHIHGGDLLPFRNVSLFLSQLVLEAYSLSFGRRVD